MKICSKCKQEKPLSEYHKDNAGLYGVHAYCKICKKLYNKNLSIKKKLNINTEVKEGFKICNTCKIEKSCSAFGILKIRKDGYRSVCKDCRKDESKIRNQELIIREKIIIEYKICTICKIEKSILCYNKQNSSKDGYRSQCKDCRKIYDKEYSKNNKKKTSNRSRKYRARKAGNKIGEIDYNVKDQLYYVQYGICWICYEKMDYDSILHIDHIVPVIKNGADSYDNLQLVHSWCNYSKGDKLMSEL